MKRVVSVWTPDWPITVLGRRALGGTGDRPPPDASPFAVAESGPNGLRLRAVNPAARRLGLTRGQPLADARAIAPDLASAPADPEAEAEALRRLALWAERYAPAVAADLDAPGLEGLFMDMTGGAHLFGGETALLADIVERLGRAGIPARAAIADTPGAAWALARFSGASCAAAPPGRTGPAIADLPAAALRLDPGAVNLLHRFGLRTIGQVCALPRAGLARRFGGTDALALVRRLDQALGAAPEPLDPVRPAPAYRAWMRFADPLTDVAGVAFHLPSLAASLCAALERDRQGARRLRLSLLRTDGGVSAHEAALSAACAAPGHIVRLFQDAGLDRLDPGFGFDALALVALRVEPLIPLQARAPVGEAADTADPAAFAALVDRIQARLGEGAALRPTLLESWIPERSEQWTQAGPEAPAPPARDPARLRPALLLDPPEPVEAIAGTPDGPPARFTWRRIARRVAHAAGPERLEPEWWRAAPGRAGERARDYYRVEDEEGRRYWLFRTGLYERRAPTDPPPRWWIHGVFA